MDRRDDHFRNGEFSWFTGEVLKVASDGSNRVKVYPHGYYDVEFNNESDFEASRAVRPCFRVILVNLQIFWEYLKRVKPL